LIAISVVLFFASNKEVAHEKVTFTRINDETGTLQIASTSYSVSIADSDEERTQGLSGTASLKPQEGMLFLFPQADYHPFWMREMRFPIDIIWIDSSWHVVGITKEARPESYPSLFYPPAPIKYVLEVPSP